MSQLTIAEKLKAIQRLTLNDVISVDDFFDCDSWSEKVGEGSDTSMLSDLTIERICSIYSDNFE